MSRSTLRPLMAETPSLRPHPLPCCGYGFVIVHLFSAPGNGLAEGATRDHVKSDGEDREEPDVYLMHGAVPDTGPCSFLSDAKVQTGQV